LDQFPNLPAALARYHTHRTGRAQTRTGSNAIGSFTLPCPGLADWDGPATTRQQLALPKGATYIDINTDLERITLGEARLAPRLPFAPLKGRKTWDGLSSTDAVFQE
jgi:hypothetical protein